MSTRVKEIRTLRAGSDLQADNESQKLVGYAALYNSPSLVLCEGGIEFTEIILPGAFDEALPSQDVRALVNHDSRLVIGRTTAGSLTLNVDDKGLAVEINPKSNTSFLRDLIENVRAGEVNQMSFGLYVLDEEWDWSGEMPLRYLKSVEVFEVSVVTFPAYPQTSIDLRSFEAMKEQKEQKQEPAPEPVQEPEPPTVRKATPKQLLERYLTILRLED